MLSVDIKYNKQNYLTMNKTTWSILLLLIIACSKDDDILPFENKHVCLIIKKGEIELLYNENNLVIEEFKEDNSYLKKYWYDGSNKLIKKTRFLSIPFSSYLYHDTTYYFYDSLQRISEIKEIETVTYHSTNRQINNFYYKYANDNVAIDRYYNGYFTGTHLFTYTNEKLEVTKTSLVSDGSVHYIEEYEYDDRGNRTKITKKNDKNEIERVQEFEYDNYKLPEKDVNIYKTYSVNNPVKVTLDLYILYEPAENHQEWTYSYKYNYYSYPTKIVRKKTGHSREFITEYEYNCDNSIAKMNQNNMPPFIIFDSNN